MYITINLAFQEIGVVKRINNNKIKFLKVVYFEFVVVWACVSMISQYG